MFTSYKDFIIFLIVCIKIKTIYCSDNLYTSDQKNVYFIDNEQKYSWFDALTKCVDMKMSLLTIETKEKSDEITSLLKKEIKNVNPLWIGGVANGKDRQYVWISNGHSVSFTNWYQGEPDFYNNNEYCLQTGWSDRIQWNDHECHKTFGVICEYNQEEKELQSKLHEAEAKLQQLHNELDKNQAQLKLELDKEYQLQKELDNKQEKLKDELAKEQQLEENLNKNEKDLQEELLKEEQLQVSLNRTQLLLEWLLDNKRPQINNYEENKGIRNTFVNIN